MSFKMIAGALAAVGAPLVARAVPSQAAILDDAGATNAVSCGINHGVMGFACTDDTGRWTGFDWLVARRWPPPFRQWRRCAAPAAR